MNIKHILLTIICIISVTGVFGQVTIKGNIQHHHEDEYFKARDYTEPLIGCNVFLKSLLDKGPYTLADIDGNYLLSNVPEGKDTLRFTFFGFESKEFEINGKNGDTIVVDVLLPEDESYLEVEYYNIYYPQITPNSISVNPYSRLNIGVGGNSFGRFYSKNYGDDTFWGFKIEPVAYFHPFHNINLYLNASALFTNIYPKHNIHDSFNTAHLGIYGRHRSMKYYIGNFRQTIFIEPLFNSDNYSIDNICDGFAFKLDKVHISIESYFSLDDFKLFQKEWNQKFTLSNKSTYRINGKYHVILEYLYRNYSGRYDLNGNESEHFGNGAVGLKYRNRNMEFDFMYLQSNNFDKKVSLAKNCGNGLYVNGLYKSDNSRIRLLRPLRFSMSYTYGKDFQTLAGHDIFSLPALGGREISVLTEEIFFFHKSRNYGIKAGLKNYNDLIRHASTQTLEFGAWYHPQWVMKRGKLKYESIKTSLNLGKRFFYYLCS